MNRRLLAAAAFLGAMISSRAHCAPVYNVSAYVSVDAGRASDWVNVSLTNITTGVVTKAVADGGATAYTSAYAGIGATGGIVYASTNTILTAGQGFNDLNWYTDFHVIGAPGTQVFYLFTTALDGVTAGAGQNYSGRVTSTAFVDGAILGDFLFDVLVNPGAFSVRSSRVFAFDVGRTIRLSSRMTVMGRADQVADIDVDAFSTSRFYVDVLTPGASYATDAGVIFPTATSIPEPATSGVFLISAGLLSCGLARRRVRCS